MLSPASAQTTSRSMKSGKPARCSTWRPAMRRLEIDVRREVAEHAADPAPTARTCCCPVGSMHRHQQERRERRARPPRRRAPERRRPARADRGSRPGAAGGAAPWSRRCSRPNSAWWCSRSAAAPRPCWRSAANAGRRRRPSRVPVRDFRRRAASRRSAPATTAITPNASAAADRNTNALTISVLSPPAICVMNSNRRPCQIRKLHILYMTMLPTIIHAPARPRPHLGQVVLPDDRAVEVRRHRR